jgi:hypothetical protein
MQKVDDEPEPDHHHRRRPRRPAWRDRPRPRATIWRTVRTLGPERAQAFVAQALDVEANGGMLVPDGSRKHTLGGIFFYLVRTQVSDEEAMQDQPGLALATMETTPARQRDGTRSTGPTPAPTVRVG